MKQQCKVCSKEFDIEDFNPCTIRQVMEKEQVCFTCAFWKVQKALDSCRPWNEGVLPIITQEFYKKVSSCNRQEHYCLTLGKHNLIRTKSDIKEIFRNITTGILTIEGYLFPYTGYSKDGGITHQGDIPVNNKDFDNNAMFIQGSEILELLNRADLYTVPVPYDIAKGNLTSEWEIVMVPEHIVRSKFNLD